MQVNILYQPGAAIAQCWLQQGETPIRAESGAMLGMSLNVDMQTSSGGLKKGLKSMMSGESFFLNTFSSTNGTGELLLAPSLPGDLGKLEVGPGQGWNIARGAFVACEDSVKTEPKFGGLKAMFSGAGLAHLEARGQGQLIVGAFGALEERQINGELIIDTGHIVAWSDSLTYKVTKAGNGFIAAFLSGEGFVCKFTGQGTVWIQTRNATAFGQTIGPKMPPV